MCFISVGRRKRKEILFFIGESRPLVKTIHLKVLKVTPDVFAMLESNSCPFLNKFSIKTAFFHMYRIKC